MRIVHGEGPGFEIQFSNLAGFQNWKMGQTGDVRAGWGRGGALGQCQAPASPGLLSEMGGGGHIV